MHTKRKCCVRVRAAAAADLTRCIDEASKPAVALAHSRQSILAPSIRQALGCTVVLDAANVPRYRRVARLCDEHVRAPVVHLTSGPSRFCQARDDDAVRVCTVYCAACARGRTTNATRVLVQKCSSFHDLSAFEGAKRTCKAVLAKRRAREAAARKRNTSDGVTDSKPADSDSLGAQRNDGAGATLPLVGSRGPPTSGATASGDELVEPVDDDSLLAILRPFKRTHTSAQETS